MNKSIKSIKRIGTQSTSTVIEINKNYDIELNEIRLKFIGERATGNASSIKAIVKGIVENTTIELDIIYQNLVDVSESWTYTAEYGRFINEKDILLIEFSSQVQEDYVIEVVYTEIKE